MAQVSNKSSNKKSRTYAFKAITSNGERIDMLDCHVKREDNGERYDITLCGVNLHNSNSNEKFAFVISSDSGDADYRLEFDRDEFESVDEFDTFRLKMICAMRKNTIKLKSSCEKYAEIQVIYDPDELYNYNVPRTAFEVFEYSVPRMTGDNNIYEF